MAAGGMLNNPDPSPLKRPASISPRVLISPRWLKVVTMFPLLCKRRIAPWPLVLSKTPGIPSGLEVCARTPTVRPVLDDSKALSAVPVLLLFSANIAASPLEMA